jgi:hypothetical protein
MTTKGKTRAILALTIPFMLVLTGFSTLCTYPTGAHSPVGVSDVPVVASGDTNWLVQEIDTATGSSIMLHENHGGFWADAEKVPGDDGLGNPAPDNAGEEDDYLCWAATASNMLEWTGWGVAGGMTENDEFLDYYEDHVTDWGSLIEYGIEWWFNGNLPCPDHTKWSQEDVDVDGFSTHTWSTYTKLSAGGDDILPDIRNWITSGYAVGLSIYPTSGPGGHAITCWGVNVDTSKDPLTEWDDHHLGIWVTDSDSHKGMADAPDVLRYYEVEWDAVNSWWWMPNYGGGWKISGAVGLEPYVGESRPVADAGGPYVGDETDPITFFAGGSTDDDPLEYRWDFDADGTWDTGWTTDTVVFHSWNDDYSGNVYLEVTDGRQRDMDITTVTVQNVRPDLVLVGDALYEGEEATASITIMDPSSNDSFDVTINWGEGADEVYHCDKGTTTIWKTHIYGDDDPSGTPWDEYTFQVTVEDDDGGTFYEYTTITVYNVAPVVSIDDIVRPNEYFIVPGSHELDLKASFSDPSHGDSMEYEVDWGDGTIMTGTMPFGNTFSESHTYMDSGTYLLTVTVSDDDGGIDTTTTMIEVANADGAMEALSGYLDGLDESSFFMNSMSRCRALSNHLDTISMMVDRGHTEMAIKMLERSFMVSLTGFSSSWMRNQWITDPVVSDDVAQMVGDLVDLIRMESS